MTEVSEVLKFQRIEKKRHRVFCMSQKELDARFKSKHGDKEAVMERMGEYDKTKIELAMEMIRRAISKKLRFKYVLADSWYTCKEIIQFIHRRRIGCHYLGCIKLGEIVSKLLAPFKNLIHTITADNGREFTNHEDVERSLKINWYFCKPYHSWERGANENTNGLIRQYIPKKTDFGDVEQDFVSIIQNKLNNRPRKRLGWLTPIEMFNKLTNLDFVALAT